MNIQTDFRETDRTTQDIIDEQATVWFARLRADNVTAVERERFQVWLDVNPAHKQAYQNVEAFWRHPDFTELLSVAAVSASASTVKPGRRWRRRATAMLAVAACLLLTLILSRPSLTCLMADYCTGIGEVRTVQLADGSRITLNSDTALSVSLQSDLRHIQLTRGEAFFAVRRNPSQPFVVASQYSQIRVLGTRFLVRQNRNSDTVTVVSGVVEVKDRHLPAMQLHADQRIVVDHDGTGPVHAVPAALAAAWMKGHVLFDNAPLGEVIAELNRYRRGSVLISNTQLKQLKVSGRFNVVDTDQALQSLRQTLPIHINYLTPWLVVIF